MLGGTEHHRQGWIPARRTPWILSPRPRHRHGCARWDTQSRQRRKQPERQYLARGRLQHGRYPGSDVPRSCAHRSRTKRSTSAREGGCPGTGCARARMAHRTQTRRRLHPHDTRQNTVLGLRKSNAGPGLASPTVVGGIRQERRSGFPARSGPAARSSSGFRGGPEDRTVDEVSAAADLDVDRTPTANRPRGEPRDCSRDPAGQSQ